MGHARSLADVFHRVGPEAAKLFVSRANSYSSLTHRTYSKIKTLTQLASCLINAQPFPANRPAANDSSLIGCTSHDMTRNIPMKIALNLPKSLFTQKLLVIQHNAFCRLFYRDCWKWLPFAATQEQRRRRHCLTALSITRCSRRSHSSVIRCRNSSTVWIFLL